MEARITGFTTALVIAACAFASAQTANTAAQPGTPSPSPPPVQASTQTRFADRLEITAMPIGTLSVRQGKTEIQPGFSSYAAGVAIGVKLIPRLYIEGETILGIPSKQDLQFDGQLLGRFDTPTMFGYTGNLLVELLSSHRKVIPYVVGGVGRLHVFRREELGLARGNTSLIGEFGVGAKVMSGWVGLRGDYRFFALRGKQSDGTSIGLDGRHGNRIYAGFVFAPGRPRS